MFASLWILIAAPLILAEVTSSAATSANGAPLELQNCRPAHQNQEQSAREAANAAALNEEDLLARLIFSEALSTGFWKNRCSSPSNSRLFSSLGWSMLARAKKFDSANIKKMIFAKNQFRTSFSHHRDNPFATAFLCPLKAQAYLPSTTSASALFEEALAISRQILGDARSSGVPSEYAPITNFFYPRSEFFGEIRPSWAPHTDPNNNRGFQNLLKTPNPCVEFYSL